jgi:adenylylsulfate kinase-like enzyme
MMMAAEEELMRPQDADLARRLAHVLWLGGATDAGKTTAAQTLAARYGLHV